MENPDWSQCDRLTTPEFRSQTPEEVLGRPLGLQCEWDTPENAEFCSPAERYAYQCSASQGANQEAKQKGLITFHGNSQIVLYLPGFHARLNQRANGSLHSASRELRPLLTPAGKTRIGRFLPKVS